MPQRNPFPVCEITSTSTEKYHVCTFHNTWVNKVNSGSTMGESVRYQEKQYADSGGYCGFSINKLIPLPISKLPLYLDDIAGNNCYEDLHHLDSPPPIPYTKTKKTRAVVTTLPEWHTQVGCVATR
jgi:hypothetical protein